LHNARRRYLTSGPAQLIETLPEQQHDPNRPEAVLKVDANEEGVGGDDAADCLRYLVATKPRTMAMHAGELTREGAGHAGVILFRRRVARMDYGKQSRLLVESWKEARDWDWTDRIEYLPRSSSD
jgi:hypothetical protein